MKGVGMQEEEEEELWKKNFFSSHLIAVFQAKLHVHAPIPKHTIFPLIQGALW